MSKIQKDNKIPTVKVTDLINDIKLGRNVKKKDIELVLANIHKAIRRYILENEEIAFGAFMKIGRRIAKSRIVKSWLTGEDLFMPEHNRLKVTFYRETKDYLNK